MGAGAELPPEKQEPTRKANAERGARGAQPAASDATRLAASLRGAGLGWAGLVVSESFDYPRNLALAGKKEKVAARRGAGVGAGNALPVAETGMAGSRQGIADGSAEAPSRASETPQHGEAAPRAAPAAVCHAEPAVTCPWLLSSASSCFWGPRPLASSCHHACEAARPLDLVFPIATHRGAPLPPASRAGGPASLHPPRHQTA